MSPGVWPESASWYAVHTKPRKERAVQSLLTSRGIGTYLPLLPPAGRKGPRASSSRPFLSCYLFAHLDLSRVALSSINWAPGVTRVVSFGSRPAVVPDEVIRWLQQRLSRLDPGDYHQGRPLRPGDRLRVVDGPLKDAEVIFDRRLSSGDRARVFVHLLNRYVACQTDIRSLRRV